MTSTEVVRIAEKMEEHSHRFRRLVEQVRALPALHAVPVGNFEEVACQNEFAASVLRQEARRFPEGHAYYSQPSLDVTAAAVLMVEKTLSEHEAAVARLRAGYAARLPTTKH